MFWFVLPQQHIILHMIWFVQWCTSDMEELWSGVVFDAVEQMLSWEPACQTEVVVSLCQKTGQDVCHNLANASQSVSKRKVRNYVML